MRATTILSPICMRMPCTAARVEPGKTYLPLMGMEPVFSYTWVTVTSAITPLMLATTFVDFSGNASMSEFPPSTKKYGERVLSRGGKSSAWTSPPVVNRRRIAARTVRIFFAPFWTRKPLGLEKTRYRSNVKAVRSPDVKFVKNPGIFRRRFSKENSRHCHISSNFSPMRSAACFERA